MRHRSPAGYATTDPLPWQNGLALGRPRLTRLAVLAYLLYYWLDRLLIENQVGRQSNLPFATGATLAVLVIVFWLLSLRKVKAFFGETHEQ